MGRKGVVLWRWRMGTSERRSEVKGEEDVKIPAFTSLWLYVEREGEREDFGP